MLERVEVKDENSVSSTHNKDDGGNLLQKRNEIGYNMDIVNMTDSRDILPTGPCSDTDNMPIDARSLKDYVLQLRGGGEEDIAEGKRSQIQSGLSTSF